MTMWHIFGRGHGEGSIPLYIKYQFHANLHITNERYLSVVDQLEGIIIFCCDGSVLSIPSIEAENVIGAADERHNKKASKITMQR